MHQRDFDMNIKNALGWFKTVFDSELQAVVRDTPFSVDLLAAIAYQETGKEMWAPKIGKLSVSDILRICVGDTIDSPGRSAFPKNKAQLERAPRGREMFTIARNALVEMARFVPAYRRMAARPHKFCHGFGIFQYDLQFFKNDPEYFLQRKWHVFDVCVANCVRELKEAMQRQGWSHKTSLTHREMVFVAIAYNRGRANLSKGFKQGHRDGQGVYYGQYIDRYLKAAKTAPVSTTVVESPPPRNQIVVEELVEDSKEVVNFDKVPRYIRNEIDQPDKAIKQGEKGKRVKRVQEWLDFHNFRTTIDEDFGPATKRCVTRFQERKGLRANGIVNTATWKALVKPMLNALAKPKKIKDLTPAETVRAVAEQHVVQHPVEIGGNNRGPWVRLYCEGNDGKDWAWCAGFVSLIMQQACFYREEEPPIKGSVSCDVLAAQAKSAGIFVRGRDIVSGSKAWDEMGGCVAFLRRRTSTDWTHTGFGLGAEGSGRSLVFDTIEGNTNDEGSREGFEACRRTRGVSSTNYDFFTF